MVPTACPSCGTSNRVPPAAPKGAPRCGACRTALPWLVKAADADFTEVTRTSLPVLVDFWAPWCQPCLRAAPAVTQLAAERAGELKVVKVNVDQAPRVWTRFGGRGVPTYVVLRDGKRVDSHVGALGLDALRTWVATAVAGPA